MPLWKKVSSDRSSRPKSNPTGHAGSVSAVAIAPDGTWLATAGGTGRCGSGTRPPASSAPPSPATPARCTAVAIAPDGTWLATAGGDGTVRIWDPATGQQRATLTGHTGPV